VTSLACGRYQQLGTHPQTPPFRFAHLHAVSTRQGEARLSLITNERGGIVDDTVIANAGDHMYENRTTHLETHVRHPR
jgi:hypothetical protein